MSVRAGVVSLASFIAKRSGHEVGWFVFFFFCHFICWNVVFFFPFKLGAVLAVWIQCSSGVDVEDPLCLLYCAGVGSSSLLFQCLLALFELLSSHHYSWRAFSFHHHVDLIYFCVFFLSSPALLLS